MKSEPLRRDPVQGDVVHATGGVEEADNRLPRWWLWAFLATIAFAAGYWYWYGSLAASPGPLESYLAARAAALDTGEEVTREMLLELSEDELTVQAGASQFTEHCAWCHGPSGGGKIGPNLTDRHWIGGGSAMDIYATVVHGRRAKGMPPWGVKLGPAVCKQVTAYLLTIRGSDLPGKAPEGEVWEPPASAAE